MQSVERVAISKAGQSYQVSPSDAGSPGSKLSLAPASEIAEVAVLPSTRLTLPAAAADGEMRHAVSETIVPEARDEPGRPPGVEQALQRCSEDVEETAIAHDGHVRAAERRAILEQLKAKRAARGRSAGAVADEASDNHADGPYSRGAEPSFDIPASASRGRRPESGRSGVDRPGSGRPGSGRPGNGGPGNSRPGSNRPQSANGDFQAATHTAVEVGLQPAMSASGVASSQQSNKVSARAAPDSAVSYADLMREQRKELPTASHRNSVASSGAQASAAKLAVQNGKPSSHEVLDRQSRMQRIQELRRARGAEPMSDKAPHNVTFAGEDCCSADNARKLVIDTSGCESLGFLDGEISKCNDEREVCNEQWSDEEDNDDEIQPIKKTIVLNVSSKVKEEVSGFEPEPEMQIDSEKRVENQITVLQTLDAPKKPALALVPSPETEQDIKLRFARFASESQPGSDEKTFSQYADGSDNSMAFDDLRDKWRGIRGDDVSAVPELRPEFRALMAPVQVQLDFGTSARAQSPQPPAPLGKAPPPQPLAAAERSGVKELPAVRSSPRRGMALPVASPRRGLGEDLGGQAQQHQLPYATKTSSVVQLPLLAPMEKGQSAVAALPELTSARRKDMDGCVHQ